MFYPVNNRWLSKRVKEAGCKPDPVPALNRRRPFI